MDKENEKNKKMPEDPVEEKPTGEEKIQDKANEAVEEPHDETKEESEFQSDEEQKDDESEESDEEVETSEEVLKDSEKKVVESKPKEEKTKKEDKKKKAEHDDDFKYIVRIANTDINGEKKLVHGLTSIKGIGHHMGVLIANETGISRSVKFGDLTDAQIKKIQDTLDKILDIAPDWMLNHRKDYETGEDLHIIGSEIDMRLRDEINIMKKIRSYRGIRHERGLPVRGQRTRANNRRGLALGVSKKKEVQ